MKTSTLHHHTLGFLGGICGIALQFLFAQSAFAQILRVPLATKVEQKSASAQEQPYTILPAETTANASVIASDEVRCFVKFRKNSSALKDVTSLWKQTVASTQKNNESANQTFILSAASLASPEIRSGTLEKIAEQTLALESVSTVTASEPNVSEHESAGGIHRLFVVHLRDNAALAQLIADLQQVPDVEYIEPEQPRYSRLLPITAHAELNDDKNTPTLTQSANDQYFRYQWSLANTGQSIPSVIPSGKVGADINITNAWGITTGSNTITVAMIDTGVPSLSNTTSAIDFTNRYVAPYNFALKSTDASDNDGHGSNIASIIGAIGNNGRLVAGINWQSRLMPLKVSTQRGTIPNSLLVQAIIYAADQGARVINMSLGGTNYSNAELDALRYAASKGVISVAAMGNDNTSTPDYPAAFSTDPTTNVIAVGATDNNDRRCNPFLIGTQASGGSNYGSHISFTAPGNAILGIGSNGTSLVYYSGTSQATPMVSGIISLLLSVRPSMQFKDVFNALKAGARDMVGLTSEDTPGWDKYYGWGRVDAYRSLAYLTTSVQETTEPLQQPFVYPNPATSVLYVNIPDHPTETIRVALLDMLGRTLAEHFVVPGANHDDFDVSSLASGSYRLILKQSSGVVALPTLIVH